MAIIENKSYLDTLDDEIGRAVRAIDWKASYKEHKKNKKSITDAVSKVRHKIFPFRAQRMSLRSVNESVLIKIGPKKRGHLAAYRGCWVRLIWLSTYGGFTMNCAVQKLKISKEVEKTLIPCGPYTKEEFTADVQARHPYNYETVDGEHMIKLPDRRWIKSTPTDAALENKEQDDIPDGGYARKELESGFAHYKKYNGRWIRTSITKSEFEDGACLELPIGTRITVKDVTGNYLYLKRTEEGWR